MLSVSPVVTVAVMHSSTLDAALSVEKRITTKKKKKNEVIVNLPLR